ncbi:MAG: hypothetical protein JO325_13085 [Solirubrobacterales bacterium]|nr:hypothetical protein [Solirubrobacterales bacterium]
MSGTRQAWLCGLLALAAIVAGCGGSGYTKSDFVARADGICTNTLRQTRTLAPPVSASGAALSAYLGKLVPLVESEANQLRALMRPADSASDRDTLTAYFAALGQVVGAYRRLEAAAARGDDQTMTDVEATLNANPVASLAARYGLKTCGTPGSTSV